MTLLAEVPWSSRVWALPFLSVLAHSERYAREQGKRHKPLTEWAGQLLLLVRSWCPEREMVAVADSSYASLKLLEIAAGGSPTRSPSLPVSGSTPPSTSQPRPTNPHK